MKNRTNLISSVMKAADGEVVGKIRMQKIFYLLEQLGLNADLTFSYHHYGPYSEDLARSLDYAEMVEHAIKEEPRDTSSGSTFIAYLLKKDCGAVSHIGEIEWDKAKSYISTMKKETSIVIELAATIHWLRHKENVEDWKAELKRRKTSKAEPALVTRAEALLRGLQLD